MRKGEAMTTWRERIAGGDFDDQRAECWGTCAVGEQHAALPQVVVYGPIRGGLPCPVCGSPHGGPQDLTLIRLGADFHSAVDDGHARAADRILDAIEDRVLALKREASEPVSGDAPR